MPLVATHSSIFIGGLIGEVDYLWLTVRGSLMPLGQLLRRFYVAPQVLSRHDDAIRARFKVSHHASIDHLGLVALKQQDEGVAVVDLHLARSVRSAAD